MNSEKQEQIDKANQEFWDELCGTQMAQALGIASHDAESLNKFDDAYLGFYPYLLSVVAPESMKNQQVLEIGLGYGTLGQKIAERTDFYQGLDNSAGPVKMMNHRLQMAGLAGKADQGSALSMPFDDESFDQVVSIGCFHHTGDTQKCIRETYRVLKPGGRALIMLYNQFSLRQWVRWPFLTAQAFANETYQGITRAGSTERQRKAYDASHNGAAAPETEFFSIKRVHRMCSGYSRTRIQKHNCDPIVLFRKIVISRERLLPYIGRTAGLDLYIEVFK